MSTLPLLKTGAVTQYPAIMVQQFSTDIVVFLDGTEQRNRNWPLAQKRWLIDLSLLDDREVRKIEEFFIAESGRYASFAFTDPWSGMTYTNCSFLEDTLMMSSESMDRTKLRLTVVENRQ